MQCCVLIASYQPGSIRVCQARETLSQGRKEEEKERAEEEDEEKHDQNVLYEVIKGLVKTFSKQG